MFRAACLSGFARRSADRFPGCPEKSNRTGFQPVRKQFRNCARARPIFAGFFSPPTVDRAVVAVVARPGPTI